MLYLSALLPDSIWVGRAASLCNPPGVGETENPIAQFQFSGCCPIQLTPVNSPAFEFFSGRCGNRTILFRAWPLEAPWTWQAPPSR